MIESGAFRMASDWQTFWLVPSTSALAAGRLGSRDPGTMVNRIRQTTLLEAGSGPRVSSRLGSGVLLLLSWRMPLTTPPHQRGCPSLW
jgi:hypothetical protein